LAGTLNFAAGLVPPILSIFFKGENIRLGDFFFNLLVGAVLITDIFFFRIEN
jgi:hypothetical protein